MSLPEINNAPENQRLEDEVSFLDGTCSGAILVLGRVSTVISKFYHIVWDAQIPARLPVVAAVQVFIGGFPIASMYGIFIPILTIKINQM